MTAIYSLTSTNEGLEEKIEDLRKQLDELNREIEIERRKNERLQLEQLTRKEELFAATVNNSRKQSQQHTYSDVGEHNAFHLNSNKPKVILEPAIDS